VLLLASHFFSAVRALDSSLIRKWRADFLRDQFFERITLVIAIPATSPEARRSQRLSGIIRSESSIGPCWRGRRRIAFFLATLHFPLALGWTRRQAAE